MRKRKLEARVVRYYKDNEKTTEEDYIVIYLRCWNEDEKKYYWGMSKSWDYRDMNEYAKRNNAYGIAEELFKDLYELQWYGYEIRFEGRKIKDGQAKWEYEEQEGLNMTRESKDLLIRLIDWELEDEEKCEMLEEDREYIRDLIRAKKEILQTIYKTKYLMDTLMLTSEIEGDINRYLKRED